ncbi:MAG: hypothetical protein WB473_13365 [Pedococcus sp.]
MEGERASAHERRALLRVALVVAALTVGVAVLLLSGLVTARLSGGDNAGGGSSAQEESFVEFTLHNDGFAPVRVVGWTSQLEGVVVRHVEPSEVRLESRGSQTVRITLRATDCAAAVPAARSARERSPLSGAGLGVVVDRPWGQEKTVVFPVMAVEEMVLASCGQDPTASG